MRVDFDSLVPLNADTDLKQYRIRGVRNAAGQIVRYLPEDIETTAAVYYLTGTLTRTSEVLRIAPSTISKWMEREEWINAITRLRRRHSDELDHKLSRIINLAYDEVVERLENGDEIITRDGERMRKRMSGRDAAWIGSVLFDKRQISRKLPTTVTNSVSADEKLNQIAQKMAEMAAAMPPPARDITPPADTSSDGNPSTRTKPPASQQVATYDFDKLGDAALEAALDAGLDAAPFEADSECTRYYFAEPDNDPMPNPSRAVMPFGNAADVEDLL